MLTIRHIRKQYDAPGRAQASHPVLQDLSLDVQRGEIFTLLGPSGCGKTTLLRSIAGLDTPDHGFIAFNGETWVDTDRKILLAPQRRGIGLVFQSYAVWPHLDVFGNVAYPLRNRRRPEKEIRDRVHRTLARVGLDGLAERATHQLSGGQQQRVAMARALVGEPDLLLLDEPFSNLDVGLRHKLRLELKELQRQLGLTVVLVTHDQEDAFALSDRIALMQAGRIAQIGTAEQLHDRPESPYVHDFIGKSSILLGTAVAAGPDGRASAAVADAEIALGDDLRVAPGAALELRVRPQDVRLSVDGAGLSGVISHTIFAGSHYETHVRLDDGQRLLAYQPRDTVWQAGQAVRVGLLAAPHASLLSAVSGNAFSFPTALHSLP